MARTVDEIVTQIDEQIAIKPILSALLTNPSTVAIWKNFRYAIAVCIAYFEQLLDKHKADMEAKLDTAGVGTMPWLRQKAFEFQYDATTPQITQLVNYIPKYPVVDPTKRIITICCLAFNTSRLIDMAVAKGSPPGPLTSTELTAFQNYLTAGGSASGSGAGVSIAGVAIVAATYSPDKLYLVAEIFYNGLYTNTIKGNVIAAIENYLINLGLTGIFHTIDLIDAIQSVEGVNDVDITDMSIRPHSTAWSGPFTGTTLINTSTVSAIKYQTVAGYAVGETTTSYTLNDTLTFTVG